MTSVSSADTIALVLTNCDQTGEDSRVTGFYLSEAAHPHHVFTMAGYEVVLSSAKGSAAHIDPTRIDWKKRLGW